MTEVMMTGVQLMLVGMGIVFLFLAMLIVAVNLMSAVVLHFYPDVPDEATTISNGIDKNITAAISAAVHQFRVKKISDDH